MRINPLNKSLAAALLGCALTFTAAHAAPPSEASVLKLMEVAQSHKMLDTLYANLDHTMRQSLQAAVAGKILTPEQKRVIDMAPARLAAVMRREMTWAALQPAVMQVYRDTFDQSEIDGLIAFYESPTGKAFVAKTPLVMQRSMVATQEQMKAFVPKLQAEMKEVMREARLTP